MNRIRIPSKFSAVMILATVSLALTSCLSYRSSDFRIYSQFTDGITFSIVAAKETDFTLISPSPMPRSGLRGMVEDHNKAWMICWNLDDLTNTQNNHPSKVIYLGDTFSDSQPKNFEPMEIRLNGSTNFVIRDLSSGSADSDRVALYAIGNNRMNLLNSVGTERPVNAFINVPHTDTPPVFSRSHNNVLLLSRTPAIYSVGNLALLRTLKSSPNFERLQGKAYPDLLTDDCKYVITIPAVFELNKAELADKAYCYDMDSDEISIKSIHFRTNQTLIVGAESIAGRLEFVAFWERSDPAQNSFFKHIGIFDENSDLIAELPIEIFPDEDRRDSYLWRDCLWDYHHSRIVVYKDRHQLTMYDYKRKVTQNFQLEIGTLTP